MKLRIIFVTAAAACATALAPALARAADPAPPACSAANNCTQTLYPDGTFTNSFANGKSEGSYANSYDHKTYYWSYDSSAGDGSNCLLDGTTCSPGTKWTSHCDGAGACAYTYSDGSWSKSYANGDSEGSYVAEWDGKTYYYSYVAATQTSSGCTLDGSKCSSGPKWTSHCDGSGNCTTTYDNGTFSHSYANGDYESSYVDDYDGGKIHYYSHSESTHTDTSCTLDGSKCSPGGSYRRTCDASGMHCDTTATYDDGSSYHETADGNSEYVSMWNGQTYYYSHDAATNTDTNCSLDGTKCSPGGKFTRQCDSAHNCHTKYADGTYSDSYANGSYDGSYLDGGVLHYYSFDSASHTGSNCSLDGTKCSPGAKVTYTQSCTAHGCTDTYSDGTFDASYDNGDYEGSYLDGAVLRYYSWNDAKQQGSTCTLDGTKCSPGAHLTYTTSCDQHGVCVTSYSDGSSESDYPNGSSEGSSGTSWWSYDATTGKSSNCSLDGTRCSPGGKVTWTCTAGGTCDYVYADGSTYESRANGDYQGSKVDAGVTSYYSYVAASGINSSCLLDGTTCSPGQKVTWTCDSAGNCKYAYADGTFYNAFANGDYEGSAKASDGSTYYYSYRKSTNASTYCLLDGSHCS